MSTPLAALVLTLTLLAIIGCASTGAQRLANNADDERAILAVVQGFFDTMETRDVAGAAKLLIPEGVFVNTRPDPATGGSVVRHFTNAEYLAQLASGAEQVRERMIEPTVLIDGDVAVVWTRYTFEKNGALSHTGHDAFNFVRTPEGWKISGGAYSVVPAVPR